MSATPRTGAELKLGLRAASGYTSIETELAAARASAFAECARICRAEAPNWRDGDIACEQCAEAIERAAAKPATSSKFSEFIRNASPEEKEVVYKRVMDAACDDQNKAIERAAKEGK
jgi:hypothetical protein